MVHTFWPLRTHSSPSSSALVCRLATSLPAPGSENIWHHTVRAAMLSGRKRFFCSSVPNWLSTGRHMPWEMVSSDVMSGKLAYSSRQMRSWARVRPAPPYALS